MFTASRARSLLRHLFRRDRVEQDLDDELRSFVEMTVEEQRRAGAAEPDARRGALLAFGGLEQVKEDVREVHAGVLLREAGRDLAHAARLLGKKVGFTAVAVTTLALGIGANTAMFSVYNAVLLQPLPYRDADRLRVIHEVIPTQSSTRPLVPVNALHFREWRAATTSFEELALLGPASYTLAGAGNPIRIDAARATPSLFRALGVEAALGRTFLEEEDAPDRDAVVVLGHELWTTQFGSDPNIIGRVIRLDGAPNVVVGVLPRGFSLGRLDQFYEVPIVLAQPRLWKPFAARPRDLRLLGSFNYAAIGRLRPGVSTSRALDELNGVQAELARQAPERAEFRAALVPMVDQMTGRSKTALQLTLGGVALVLLIACVNITNLLLADGGRRQREFAIRRAAGATRGRLVRQVLAENLLLSAVAGLLGMVVGVVLLRAIQAYAPVELPRMNEVAFSAPGLLFTFVVTLVAGLLIGVLPAWRATRSAPLDLLRTSSATASSGVTARRLRSTLTAVEVAASAVCLVVGALLVTSFVNLLSVERGFKTESLITVDLALPGERYDSPEEGVRLLERVTERVRALPGVSSVGVTDRLPLSGVSNSAIMVEGTVLPRQERPSATIRSTDAGYLGTLGIPLREGRLIEPADAGRRVAVVSDLAARRLWPRQPAVGRRFRFGPDDSPFIEVVGVVGDVRGVSLSEDPALTIYVPLSGNFYNLAAVAVRTASESTAVAPVLREIIRTLDPELAITAIRTMDDIVAESVAPRRFQMNLVLLLGLAAVLLASLGIYGVMSQAVIQRTSELGIRMALGADASAIHRLVLGQGMVPVFAGLAAGIVIALGLGRLLQSMLFRVSPAAVVPVAGAAIVLIAVALAASFIPAWRASRIDPMRALRYE